VECPLVPVLPNCLALILCDDVVRHRDTGRIDLVGAFWKIRSPSLPAKTGPFTAWVALINGAGRMTMRLKFELLRPDRFEEEPLMDIAFTMVFSDPRLVREYEGRIHGIDFVRPCPCRGTLTADDVTLVQSYFIALQAGPSS
jgi:hypothetical protein